MLSGVLSVLSFSPPQVLRDRFASAFEEISRTIGGEERIAILQCDGLTEMLRLLCNVAERSNVRARLPVLERQPGASRS